MSASTGMGELSYGSFYLPAVAFGYLSTQSPTFITENLPLIQLPGLTLEPIYLLYFLTVLSFLGAIQAHGIARAIYGPDGPADRPKHKSIHIQHALAIILNEDPDNIPIIPCRIAAEGYVSECLNYIVYRSRKLLYSLHTEQRQKRQFKNRFGPVPPRHRLEIGLTQLTEFKHFLSWRKVPRFVYFTPMGLQKQFAWAAVGLLIAFSALNSPTYVALILIFAHVVLLLRGLFWVPIPDYLNAGALDDRFTAEYQKREEEMESTEREKQRLEGDS